MTQFYVMLLLINGIKNICDWYLVLYIFSPGPLSLGGRLSWSWSYGCWIYNNLCNQCLSPLKLWVQNPFRRDVLDTTLWDKVCQWLATVHWFSSDTPASSTNIVESGIKHHKPSQTFKFMVLHHSPLSFILDPWPYIIL